MMNATISWRAVSKHEPTKEELGHVWNLREPLVNSSGAVVSTVDRRFTLAMLSDGKLVAFVLRPDKTIVVLEGTVKLGE